MLRYPYALYSQSVRHSSLFKNLTNTPYPIDLSDHNSLFNQIDVRDQKTLHNILRKKMDPDYSWGIGGYLEQRARLLKAYPQMTSEARFYHLGVDILVPVGSDLHAPLDAIVKENGYEKGEGNYGGFVLLEHYSPLFETFYSFYGHLNPDSLAPVASVIQSGESFGRVGDFHQNGNWYHHTHLQIITKRGLREGYLHKGYCSKNDILFVHDLCPNPLPLFKI